MSDGIHARHTDNSRSPAPDIAVPRQALCYLSRSNRGTVLTIVDFFTTSAFLSSPSKSRKSQATKCRAFKKNSVLNKHRISKVSGLLIHYNLAPIGLVTMGLLLQKSHVKIRLYCLVI